MLRESRLTTGICSSRIEIMGFCQKTRKEANYPMKHQLLALLLGSLLLLGLPAACADTPHDDCPDVHVRHGFAE